jgi:hypothetical protein
MKYLKTYEQNSLKYNIGDIIVCSDSYNVIGSKLKSGQKYKVINIDVYGYIKVMDIENYNVLNGIYPQDRFKLEIEYDADKYNL